jgi:hypothetical protein
METTYCQQIYGIVAVVGFDATLSTPEESTDFTV